MSAGEISEEAVSKLFEDLDTAAEGSGYHLNPDTEFTRDLLKSLLVNEDRYGYRSCPCRLATGNKEIDLDIICPCDYRDPDLDEYGACYCALYVSGEIKRGEKQAASIPERRLPPAERAAKSPVKLRGKLPVPVWRCKVCGYLCGREHPPETCPICKAKKERFELFIEA